MEVAGEPTFVDAGRDQVGRRKEMDPGSDQATIPILDVIDADGEVGSAGVADPDIASNAAGRDELDQLQVVGRSAPGLPGQRKLRDLEMGVRVANEPARVLVCLLLAVDELETRGRHGRR